VSERAGHGAKRWLAAATTGVLGMLFLLSIVASSWTGQLVVKLVDWVANQGWYGQGVFLCVLIAVCLTGIIPASVLAMAAGTVYGFGKGALLSALGLSVGGVVGFLAARHLFRDLARPWVSGRVSLRKIDADIARQGWKIVALLRLSPVAPFGITSYALGLTRLRFREYLLGSIGSLPAMMAYVYMGVLARAALHASARTKISWVRLAVMGLGVIATIIAAAHFHRVLNRAAIDADSGADP
jgi:uncharacterized membrane protein YdjX (TVP38/TMEM64 family)